MFLKGITIPIGTIVLGALFLVSEGQAQQQTAELTGKVSDASGAAISGATVTVANPAHGIKMVVASDAQGDYVAPLLPPADGYQITVSKPGFNETTRRDITLQVAQVARVDIALAVGSVAQSVTVTGAPPLLDTQTSSLGQVIPERTIVNLPLNGRSSFRLIQLTPGVVFSSQAYGQFGDVPVNTNQDSNFSINGGTRKSNDFLIDGVPSGAGFFNSMTTIPSVDDTQEFNVQSDNVSAEYGRFGGGVINVTTKSGTNELHGVVFEFLRNSALDANDYIDNRAGVPVPPFKMNQFGFAAGGPVVLPRLYHGRDRTFFFVDYQGTRRVQGSTTLLTVPTLAQRNGDFSQTLDAKGQPVIIYNPFSTRPDPANPTQYIRDPFPGNVIPASLQDPVARKLMTYYPLPNTTGAPYTNADNFLSNAPLTVNEDAGSARIDQNVTDRYHFFGRFAVNFTALTQPNAFGNIADRTGAVGTTYFHNWSFALDNTVVFSPTLLLTIDYGFARWFQFRQTLSYGFNNATLGFPNSLVSQITIPMFPSITVSAFTGLANQSYLHNGNDSHSLLTSLTKIHGRQTFTTGTDVRMHLINLFTVSNSAGSYTFMQAQTQGPNPNTASIAAGSGLASLLLGAGNSGSIPIGSGVEMQDWYFAGYLQDDFRFSDKLTLNLGLRYETETPYTDRHNKLNYFNPAVASPASNSQFPNLAGGLVFAGVSGNPRNVYRWNTNQFDPRIGFAYTPLRDTVVRGGFGIVYAPLEITNNQVGSSPSGGFSSSTAWQTSLNGGLTPFNLLSNPYPQGLVPPTGSTLGASTLLGQSLSVWDPTPKTPQTYQWNFGVQRQFPSSMLVDLAYVGTRGLHLTDNFDLDTINPSYLSLGTALQALVPNPFAPFVTIGPLSHPKVSREQLLLPYPQFTDVLVVNSTWGDSVYHSMQLKVDKRTTHGVSFLAVYTVGKLISDVSPPEAAIGSASSSTPAVQNFYDLPAERSVSEMDIPQALLLNSVAQLPFGPGMRFFAGAHGFVAKLIGGWSGAGILTEESGFPLVLTAPIVSGGNRPNYVPGVSPKLPSSRSTSAKVLEWFNTKAFAIPPPFTYGNVSRTVASVRSPSVHNLDFSVIKEIPLTERFGMEFRAESFNLTNTAHFGTPDTNMADTTFGQITATLPSPPPRELQFALKLSF